jgi:hypothetical protein
MACMTSSAGTGACVSTASLRRSKLRLHRGLRSSPGDHLRAKAAGGEEVRGVKFLGVLEREGRRRSCDTAGFIPNCEGGIQGCHSPRWCQARPARRVRLTSGPRGASIPFRVFLDGQLATDERGSDVDPDGIGMVSDQRTYQLIRQPGAIADRLFGVELLDAGVEAYCFTFG